jgi:prepilin-type N-terminal cleavage/methylation domain-containing protein
MIPRQRHRGYFTLIELLVVVAIIAILAAMLMPSLSKARARALLTQCISNQKQVGIAMIGYLDDNSGVFPIVGNSGGINTGYVWMGKKGTNTTHFYRDVTRRPLNDYLGYSSDGGEVAVVECPSDHDSSGSRYDYVGTSYMGAARFEHSNDLNGNWNGNSGKVQTDSGINNPTTMVLSAGEGAWHYSKFADPTYNYQWHFPGKARYPFAFVDGHAATHGVGIGEGIDHTYDTVDFVNSN